MKTSDRTALIEPAGPADPLRWPEGASAYLKIPVPTLLKRRQDGDAPKLYAIGRALFTTRQDLNDWVLDHEVAPGFKARPPVVRKPSARREAGGNPQPEVADHA